MASILVIGAGYMGCGIGQVCAQAGWQVHLMDVKAAALDKAMTDTKWSLDKLNGKGVLKEPTDIILNRIKPEHDFSCAAKVSWVIEASPEIESLKDANLSRSRPACFTKYSTGLQHVRHSHHSPGSSNAASGESSGPSLFRTCPSDELS